MKIRILMVTEATFINTGYAVYCRELLSRLSKIPEIEIAEFACYAHEDDPKILSVPWKLYPNAPDSRNEKAMGQYNAIKANHFGLWRFDNVCLDFKPHIVLTIRDYWMDAYIEASPFRRFFKWIWMPTVDAEPQNEQWIDTFAKCDAILTYNDWSGQTLIQQAGKKIKWFGEAPPCAPLEYFPVNKKEIKEKLGFEADSFILGTVMRNQRRKLFPDLFASFRQFLDEADSNRSYLYCHTSYPDNQGWDIPALLKEHRLCSKVLFTYVCRNPACKHVFPSFFSDAAQFCLRCNELSATMSNVQNGASPKLMNFIYNLFDYYVQYSNSEGFGIPLVEAAACGVPIMAVDYSAMSDILTKLNGVRIPTSTNVKELETGCNRAAPDNKAFVKLIHLAHNEVVNTPKVYEAKSDSIAKLCRSVYTWEKTVGKWIECFNSLPMPNDKLTWGSKPRIHEPVTQVPQNISTSDYVKWLLINVLGEPERLNSYMEMRMVKDLNYGRALGGIGGMYYNEEASMFDKLDFHEFTREIAFNQMKSLCERRNYYEKKRCSIS